MSLGAVCEPRPDTVGAGEQALTNGVQLFGGSGAHLYNFYSVSNGPRPVRDDRLTVSAFERMANDIPEIFLDDVLR